MKYSNTRVDAKARKTWIKVKGSDLSTKDLVSVFAWCEEHPSNGKFYSYHLGGWWFELEEDAMMFILKWL